MLDDAQPVVDWPDDAPRTSRLLWVLISTSMVAALVFVALVVSARPDSSQEVTPEIGSVTEAMLVNGAPNQKGAPWITETRDQPGDGSVIGLTPAECGYLTLGFASTRRVSGSYVADSARFDIALETTGERPDLGAVVERCARYTYGARSSGGLRPVDLPGLPTWATAVVDTGDTWSDVIVCGFYRGVYIRAHYAEQNDILRPDRSAALVEMFNEQVDKLARL